MADINLTNPQTIIRAAQLLEFKAQLEAILQSKKITSIQGLTAGTVEAALAELLQKITQEISKVYKPAGSIAAAGLVPALLVEANTGKVYNLNDEATTTADWLEGAGKKVAAGTDVTVVEVEEGGSTVYKFNALAGHIDLSGYKQVQEAVASPAADGTGIEFIDSVSQDAQGVITPHKKTVQNATAYESAQQPGQAGLLSAQDKAKIDTVVYATSADIAEMFPSA